MRVSRLNAKLQKQLMSCKSPVASQIGHVDVIHINSKQERNFNIYQAFRKLGICVPSRQGSTQSLLEIAKGGTVVFLRREDQTRESGECLAYGFALCSMKENFCKSKGLGIALGRAIQVLSRSTENQESEQKVTLS